jgi:hypothetical protein
VSEACKRVRCPTASTTTSATATKPTQEEAMNEAETQSKAQCTQGNSNANCPCCDWTRSGSSCP